MSVTPLARIRRHIYVPQSRDGVAPWVQIFGGPDGYREEIHTNWAERFQKRGYGDTPMGPRRRISRDNGKSWGAWEKLPECMDRREKLGVLTQKMTGGYDPVAGKYLSLYIQQVRDMRAGPPRGIHCHSLLAISNDGQALGGPQVLRYEDGQDLDPSGHNLLDPEFLSRNTAYPGQSILAHSNGTLVIPLTNTRIPDSAGDDPGRRIKWPAAGQSGSLCMVGTWNGEAYDWRAGAPVWLPRTDSVLGLLEADIAELSNGDVLGVWRVTKSAKEKPNYKYCAVSKDGGLTFGTPNVMTYSDGRPFFSPSSYHRLFRSSKTQKLYWIGNIHPKHSDIAGRPRFPLVIAEVDEQSYGLIRDTQTVIDSRRKGDGEDVQLSNFWIIENSETLDLEVYLTRLGENGGDPHNANAYKYVVSFNAG